LPTIAPFMLPRVLPEFRTRFPELSVYLKEDVVDNLHQQLMDGELDLLLIALPYDLSGAETQTLFKDRFVLAHHKDSKLVDKKHASPNKLDRESLILLEESHCLRQHAMQGCNIKRRDKISRFAASSLFTLVQMIDCDLGVTLLPEMAEDTSLVRCTNVITQPLPENNYREIGLAWRRGTARSSDYQALGDLIKEYGTSTTH